VSYYLYKSTYFSVDHLHTQGVYGFDEPIRNQLQPLLNTFHKKSITN
jgi:hypothetical protein